MIIITFIRSLIYNFLFYTLAFALLLVTVIIAPFVSYKVIDVIWNAGLLHFFRWLLYIICGLKIEIRGKENILKNKGAVYAAKHQSALETYFLTSFIKNGATFIFKKELNYIPIFGWVVYFYGSIPIDRKGGSATMKRMLNKAQEFINNKRSIIIFPEGTRTTVGETTTYKPGIAFLYQNLDTEVIPIAHNTGMFWKKKSFLRYPGKIIIEFMKPIKKNMDKKDFMNELKHIIENKCEEINLETIKNYPHMKSILIKSEVNDKH